MKEDFMKKRQFMKRKELGRKTKYEARNVRVAPYQYVTLAVEPSLWEVIECCAKAKGITYQEWVKNITFSFVNSNDDDTPATRTMYVREAAQREIVERLNILEAENKKLMSLLLQKA